MKFNRDNKYLAWGLTAFAVIAASMIFYSLLTRWDDVSRGIAAIVRTLSPILIGVCVSYLLSPVLNMCERGFLLRLTAKLMPKHETTARKLARALAVAISLILLLAFIVGLFMLVIPQLVSSAEKLVRNSNAYLNTARTWISGFFQFDRELETTAESWISTLISYATTWLENSIVPLADVIVASVSSGLVSVVRGIVDAAVGFIVSAYLLYSKETFQRQLKNLLNAILSATTVERVETAAKEAHRLFGGFLLGKMLASIIVGALCSIFMTVTGMPY
ncbi:MAG: AI-2E family transporter, partial [Oscillospiraceae bacterium]|nr:AI-2E family transporter [Oscillospiraceae bacterium]